MGCKLKYWKTATLFFSQVFAFKEVLFKRSRVDRFYLFILGMELWQFKHRIPFSEVQELMIKGDISVEDVVFDGGDPELNPAVANHSDQVLNPAVEKFE